MTVARHPAIMLGLLAAAVLCAFGLLTAYQERGTRPTVAPEAARVAHIDQLTGGPIGSTLIAILGPVDTTHADPPAAHEGDNDSSPGALPSSVMPAPPAEPEPSPVIPPAENAPPPPPPPASSGSTQEHVAPPAPDPNRPSPEGCLNVSTGEDCVYPG